MPKEGFCVHFNEIALKTVSAPAECLRSKMYNIYLLTLKLQFFSSNSEKFDLTDPFDKQTVGP